MPREKRLIENEVIFRDVNKTIQEFIEIDTNLPVEDKFEFYCECSKPDCLERIKLTVIKYKELHENKRHFVILKGHEFPEIERVIVKTPEYQVVEKYLKPPKASDISSALHSISKSL